MTWAEIAAILSAVAAVTGILITSLLTIGKIGRMAGVMETTLLGQGRRIEEVDANQGKRIEDVSAKIEKMNAVLIQVAVQNNRLDNMGQQIAVLSKDMADLRRGEGWIFSLPAPKQT